MTGSARSGSTASAGIFENRTATAAAASELAAREAGAATAVVLGCAGMSAHLGALQAGTRLTLVDGVRAAAGLAAALVLAAPKAA